MDPKLLTEPGLKALLQKFKVKDNGLQKALAAYQALDEGQHDERLKAIGTISQLAGALKRAKEVASKEDVVDYLTDVAAAAESERRDIAKEKAATEKTTAAAAKAVANRQEQEGEEDDDDEEDEEDEAADSYQKLASALKSLRTSKKPYYFVACDSKPYGLVISRKDITKNAQARKELSQVSGGSKRPPRVGECRFESGKYVFEMRKPPAGLARILQKWIKDATGIGVRVMVGAESGDEPEDDEVEGAEQGAADQTTSEAESETAQQEAEARRPASGEQEGEEEESEEEQHTEQAGAEQATQSAAGTPAMPRTPLRPALENAPDDWHQTRDLIDGKINELKEAVRQAFTGEGEDLLADIEQGMNKMDGILGNLDKSLADSLAKANAAANPAARRTELNKSKTILANYINYVKSEPLIAQIDSNPFGVRTDLKKTLIEKLRHMAQAIG